MGITYQTGGLVPYGSYFQQSKSTVPLTRTEESEFFTLVRDYIFEHICPCGHFYKSCMQRSKDAYCFSSNNFRRLDGYPPCRKRLLQRFSRKKEHQCQE